MASGHRYGKKASSASSLSTRASLHNNYGRDDTSDLFDAVHDLQLPCHGQTFPAMTDAERHMEAVTPYSFESQAMTPNVPYNWSTNSISSNNDHERQHATVDENDLKHVETAASSAGGRPPMSLPHEIAFVCIISMAQLLTQSGLGQVIAPLHIIGQGLDSSTPASLSWYAAAYSLTVGTFILPSGRLGDLFGHKRIFVIGWAWFSLWSVLAGFSPYVQKGGLQGNIFFAFCRAMQGIGPSLMLPNGLAILGRTYKPGHRKNMAFAAFGSVAPGGAVLGMVFGSLLAEKASWPWAFYIMGITTAVMCGLSILIVPDPDAHEFKRTDTQIAGGWKRLWTQLDATGMILGVVGLVLINFSWNQGPVVGWGTPYTYFILIIGLLILAAFCYHESKADEPLIPLDALTRDTLFVLVCMACGWSCFGVWVYYMFQFNETIRGFAPLLAGAQFVPAAFSGIAAAFATGFLLSKLRPEMIMFLAMSFFTIGISVGGTAPVKQTYWAQTFVSIIVMCWGMDMSFPSGTIIMSNAVKRHHQGVAASLINTVVNYSISIGLGIAATVESRVDSSGEDQLSGYRSAFYTGMGLAGTGVLVGVIFVTINVWDEKRGRRELPPKH